MSNKLICSKLINAKEMSRKSPDTFEWIDYSDELMIGSYVKISNGKERFWVAIEEISKDKSLYVGKIDYMINNNLRTNYPVFSAENIYQKFRVS